jgi:hypothetical protein
MPKIVYLDVAMFDPDPELATLVETAARHELVLICARHVMIGGRLAVLRQALAPRRMVALLIDGDLRPIERVLVADLLNDGVIPIVVAVGDAPTSALMSWLEDDDPSAVAAGHCPDRHRIKASTPQRRSRRRASPSNDKLRPAA